MNAWLYQGGGLELWEELYARYDLVPTPAGNTGVQMAGWFNKELNSMDDLRGIKMTHFRKEFVNFKNMKPSWVPGRTGGQTLGC